MSIRRMTFQSGENNAPSPGGAEDEQVASLNFSENLFNREWASGGFENIDGRLFQGHA